MKIVTNDLKDQVSVMDLRDEEYTMLLGAVKAAASDLTVKGIAFVVRYGSDRDTMVNFSNKLEAAHEARISN
jgi:hypothetical protein